MKTCQIRKNKSRKNLSEDNTRKVVGYFAFESRLLQDGATRQNYLGLFLKTFHILLPLVSPLAEVCYKHQVPYFNLDNV